VEEGRGSIALLRLRRGRWWRRRKEVAIPPALNKTVIIDELKEQIAALAKLINNLDKNRNGGGDPPAAENSRADQTARRNNATGATFTQWDLAHPFAEGGFRWVAKGTYTNGVRNGEPCVCKWFKSGHVDQASYFDLDIKAMDKAHDLVREWNNRNLITKLVMVNIPEVWTFTATSGPLLVKRILQEPFINNYQKFNSNTGWADSETPWPRVMQALSHFSTKCLLVNSSFVICKVEFILMQLCLLIQSYYRGANCMV
jgi:hypothetical protein